jgi:hypothetical protein
MKTFNDKFELFGEYIFAYLLFNLTLAVMHFAIKSIVMSQLLVVADFVLFFAFTAIAYSKVIAKKTTVLAGLVFWCSHLAYYNEMSQLRVELTYVYLILFFRVAWVQSVSSIRVKPSVLIQH